MGARELLHDVAEAGLHLRADGDKLVIRPASKLTDDLRHKLRQAKPELLALLAGGPVAEPHPYRLTRAEADEAHAIPWTNAQCSAFTRRVVRMVAIGVHPTDADDLAERLHLRDIDRGTRRMCVECRHLRGNLSNGPTCANHKKAGIGIELSAEMVVTLQRCGGFNAG
jgi:TubC N-terminal docking domain